MNSLWSEYYKPISSEPLVGDTKTDVLIIGGGLCGILCAKFLSDEGINCAVVDRGKVYSGNTLNTTAKITSQHGLIYSELLKKKGFETAKMYYDANNAALGEYKKMCGDIDCDFEIKSAFVYSTKSRDKIEKEITAARKLGADAIFHDSLSLPVKVTAAEEFKNQAQFNPAKFLSAVLPGLTVYEDTPVYEIRDSKAFTSRGTIKAEYFIVATHFPIINKHGGYFMKMHQERAYVAAYENAFDPGGMYIDEDKNGFSFRSAGNLLLIGAGSQRPGAKGEKYALIESFMSERFPLAKEKNRWAAEDCMTIDKIPYIGAYSPQTPNMLVATGFNKWGMTSSMAAAMILRDSLTGKDNEYAAAFRPDRFSFTAQFFKNSAQTAVSMLTPTVKRCPHLGCALKWNSTEQSWDCPCHGSRFSASGELLNEPATGGLNRRRPQ